MMHYFKGEPPRELENILDVASQSERQYSVVITISFGGGLAPVSIRSIIYILPAILLLRLFNKYRSVAPNLSVVVRVIDVSYLTLQVNPELAATDVYRLSNERMAFCQQFVHAHAPDVAARISFVKLHALHEAKHVLLPSQECVDSVLADIEFTAKELDTLKTMAKPRKLTSAATGILAPRTDCSTNDCAYSGHSTHSRTASSAHQVLHLHAPVLPRRLRERRQCGAVQ